MARIDQAFEAFLASRRTQGLRPAVEELYRTAWRLYRRVPGSHRPTRALLTMLPIQPPFRGRPDAIRHLTLLRPAWAFLQAQGAMPAFPLPPRLPLRRIEGREPLTDDQVQQILRAVPDPGVRMLGLLVYLTGIRAGRLVCLRPEHVDLPNCTLHVPAGALAHPGPISRDAADALTTWQGLRSPQSSYFLHDEAGHPLTPPGVSHALRLAGQAAGSPCIGFGHLQYAHLRLLAQSHPALNQALLEHRLQQPFRLRYLRIPSLHAWSQPLRASNHLSRVLEGEDL